MINTRNLATMEYDFMKLATTEGKLSEELENGNLTEAEISEKKSLLRCIARKTSRLCLQMHGRTSRKDIPFEKEEPFRWY